VQELFRAKILAEEGRPTLRRTVTLPCFAGAGTASERRTERWARRDASRGMVMLRWLFKRQSRNTLSDRTAAIAHSTSRYLLTRGINDLHDSKELCIQTM
jgi:hypothetical protein